MSKARGNRFNFIPQIFSCEQSLELALPVKLSVSPLLVIPHLGGEGLLPSQRRSFGLFYNSLPVVFASPVHLCRMLGAMLDRLVPVFLQHLLEDYREWASSWMVNGTEGQSSPTGSQLQGRSSLAVTQR